MTTLARSIRLMIVGEDQLSQALVSHFQGQGMTVMTTASGGEALARAAQDNWDVALLDLHLPGMSGIELLEKLRALQPELEVILLTAHERSDAVIEAMRRGAFDYLVKPFHLSDLELRIQKACEKAQLVRRQRQWLDQVDYESSRCRLIGSSPLMQRLARLIQKVAPTNTPVLICGASGTGKGLVASLLHYNSLRRDRPLVTVNCADLEGNQLESELFGHDEVAFSGAVQPRRGLIEMAEGGTLFIDNIAETPPGLQARLVRVLEDGHYRRVCGTRERQANVRVLAAIRRLLHEECRAGRFREDLYYRLNVVTIELPPLRQHALDIPELVEHFLQTHQVGPTRHRIHPDALETLVHYGWPGNVRELANVLERAQILAREHLITMEDLPEGLVGARSATTGPSAGPRDLRELERRHVLEILQQEQWNKFHAANALGISRRALYRLIEKHHLEEYRTDGGPGSPGSAP